MISQFEWVFALCVLVVVGWLLGRITPRYNPEHILMDAKKTWNEQLLAFIVGFLGATILRTFFNSFTHPLQDLVAASLASASMVVSSWLPNHPLERRYWLDLATGCLIALAPSVGLLFLSMRFVAAISFGSAKLSYVTIPLGTSFIAILLFGYHVVYIHALLATLTILCLLDLFLHGSRESGRISTPR
jgi:hypothetical protein